ncbi:unnamed protein product [Schistosoma spindalis]|nr:unnamed protein product [Schistosoma spindale]
MYRTLLFNANFFIFWLINLSIQDVEYWRSKKLFIEYSLDKTRNKFNKEISGNNKSINNYIECCRIKAEAFFGATLMTKIIKTIENGVNEYGVILPESLKLINCYNAHRSTYKQIISKYGKDICIGLTTYPRKITYEFQLNIANEINKHLSNYDKLIMKKDDIEFDFKHSELHISDAINMELSKEHQTIDQYMMCRSKIYQTIEQKILMGELINELRTQENIYGITIRNSHIMKECFTEEQSVYAKLENEYRNEACQLPVSNNIQDIKVVDQLISKRFYYLRAFNKELFYHQYLWRILEEISYH